jgi:uridine kinase
MSKFNLKYSVIAFIFAFILFYKSMDLKSIINFMDMDNIIRPNNNNNIYKNNYNEYNTFVDNINNKKYAITTLFHMNKNNSNKNNNKGKVIVIGIGGISRSGKTSMTNKLKEVLNPIDIFGIDDYGIGPIRKFDENINDYIDDWESPEVVNLDKYYLDLKNLKENTLVKDNEIKYILVEGYLLYNREDITNLIDLKFNYFIDKEIARERRKNTKFYNSDYYFDEYIWNQYFINK